MYALSSILLDVRSTSAFVCTGCGGSNFFQPFLPIIFTVDSIFLPQNQY